METEKKETETMEKEKTMSRGKKIWAEIWQYKWLYFWICMAGIFCIVIYFWKGSSQAIDFAGGYLIELSLSVDNLFVFLLIFISFGIPEHAQHKVLNYGIMGTIVLRFVFIFLGITLINRFEWLLWVFGGLLIISGAKMFKPDDEDDDPREGILYRITARFMPMSEDFDGEKFIVANDGTNYDKKSLVSKKAKKLFTPLSVVMVLLIFSDIIFAIDSVPAVISMTRDMFIVYTSNMFAIMGLRQLFFVLEHMHEKFRFVKYGVAVILVFTGVKMLLDIFHIRIHNLISIAVILVLLIASVIISVVVSKRTEKKDSAGRMERKKDIEMAFEEAEKEGRL